LQGKSSGSEAPQTTSCSLDAVGLHTAKPPLQQRIVQHGSVGENNHLLQLLLCQPSTVDATLWDLQHQLPPAHQLRTDTLARLVQLHFSLAKHLNTVTAELLQAQGTDVQELLSDASAINIKEDAWHLLYNLVQVELFHLMRAKVLQREHKDRMQYTGWF
jgi:hypothetical protein